MFIEYDSYTNAQYPPQVGDVVYPGYFATLNTLVTGNNQTGGLEAVSKPVVSRATHRAAPLPPSNRACQSPQ
jgi:hypothetical protein